MTERAAHRARDSVKEMDHVQHDTGRAGGWTLTGACARNAVERPGHTALICEDRRTSYGQLHHDSNRAAHALIAAGMTPGSRVAYLGRESEHYYLTVLACAKAGAVIVPVNWRLTTAEVQHIVRDSGAQLLFVDEEFAATAEQALTGATTAPGPAVVRLDGPGPGGVRDRGAGLRAWYAQAPATAPDLDIGPDDAVLQIYTSGTTGLPKGVVLAHRTFFTLPEAMRATGADGDDWIDWRPEDVSLVSLPGFGIAGIGWFLHGFCAGATHVVMPMYVPTEAVRLIREYGVTITFVAPAMLQMMLDERGVSAETFASLRKIAYGAAPISEKLLLRSLEVFGCQLAQIYASTEAGSVAVCLPPSAHLPGSPLLKAAGRPCPGNEIKIVDRQGGVLGPGQIGQVCLRTPAHMLGYHNRPEATAQTLVDGWLHMGDAGYLDADGYLFLCDRINDTIIVAGQNIYPAEVEKQLSEHPAVADAAVVGVPDERWGEAVHAAVVLRPGTAARPRELLLFLRGRLADYKIPVRYHVLDVLPRNPSGKILRRLVREQLAQRLAEHPDERRPGGPGARRRAAPA
ncbi:Long-chain-fatty-acid--CoA ligase FadD13 [Streptomyces sp. ADI96-15]|nr:long-chain-fatty-acid--CoA ligase [Streptomyces sp. GBA 94-10 4N24]ESQ07707.1 long-chain-fatty-acid--CoA ligase [Streptomyces sp. PVA_94-07]RPK54423.1 Long-chain-fatty-acid--CoA ligase FadD13 [Streptomyces sp. ADI96-15]ESQ01701.1 long-chain-fatty-acid--CoA ligase [Streptomyces sp. GBA 94-10 4N24]UZN57105.1 long-chain-fatty-acid--CoA ligase [Streptomyces sp. GBA 94-10 4N24]